MHGAIGLLYQAAQFVIRKKRILPYSLVQRMQVSLHGCQPRADLLALLAREVA
jgi:hypothetical protein